MAIIKMRFKTPDTGEYVAGTVKLQLRPFPNADPFVDGRDAIVTRVNEYDVPQAGASISTIPAPGGWYYHIEGTTSTSWKFFTNVFLPNEGTYDLEELETLDPKDPSSGFRPEPIWWDYLNGIEAGLNKTRNDLDTSLSEYQDATQALEDVFLGGTEAVNDAAVSTYVGTDGTATRAALFDLAAVVDPKKLGINGTGSVDVTSSLQSIINAATSAGQTVHLGPGTYRIDGTLTFPHGMNLQGQSREGSVIQGQVILGSNQHISDVTIHSDGRFNRFANGSEGSVLERVTFKGGSSQANLYMNDSSAKNLTFTECYFIDNSNGGNGVSIVDKGTSAKHYENFKFTRCEFRNNDRMNFECLQRSDSGFPVVLGYRSIDLYDCVFEQAAGTTANEISVSYDSGKVADGSTRSSGYSIVRGNRMKGGYYGLELAGPRSMTVEGNQISDITGAPLSTSQFTAEEYVWNLYSNNRIEGSGDVMFNGAGNIVTGNHVRVAGRACRVNSGADSTFTGNHFETTAAGNAVVIDKAFDIKMNSNTLIGGFAATVLNFGPSAIRNSYVNNRMVSPALRFQTSDPSTKPDIRGNSVLRISFGDWFVGTSVGAGDTLPPANLVGSGGMFVIQESGVEDKFYIVIRNSAGASQWRQIALA